MSENVREILVIVEGAKTDIRLMERLLMLYGIDGRHQIVSYNTNIYLLYNSIFNDPDPESLDILLHLKSREPNPDKRAVLDRRYSEVLLIFDFDPQDPHFADEKIKKMMGFFSESTEMGKLYINYPMIEAFYHMKNIPDSDFNSYIATMNELESGLYKDRVNKETRIGDYAKYPVNKNEASIIIRQNINKAWHILLSKTDESIAPPDSMSILEVQLAKREHEKVIAILCTCIFYIVDYNPMLL
ncbi:MAG: hypothetical protein FWE11_02020 [Defluviitaleaceae bacterium]|nr:hypothetical protein [Defluviitaleaceae bacterium]